MKYFVVFVVLICLAFPVFGQSATAQRHRALSEAMGSTITRSTAALADFDSRSADSGTMKVYSSFFRRYNSIADALEDSEFKMNFLLRANARNDDIKEERDRYDSLLKQLQETKTEYDNWLRTVQ